MATPDPVLSLVMNLHGTDLSKYSKRTFASDRVAALVLAQGNRFNRILRKYHEVNPTDAYKDLMVTVLVPAYNEEDHLETALLSLLDQERPFDHIIIASDNSTDRTVEIARRIAAKHPSVTVFETVNNTAKKAGALNQAWANHAQDADYVVCMDGDTMLHSNFCAEMLHDITSDSAMGGVAVRPALKLTPPEGTSWWGGVIWRLVAVEYAIYGRSLQSRKYRTEVLAGCGAIVHNHILTDITEGRPYVGPWDEKSIVEDYRLTLDIRKLGHIVKVSPKALAFTDSPVSVRSLWRQRVRWQAGTLMELKREGWKPWTRRSWAGQLINLFSLGLRILILLMWLVVLYIGTTFSYNPIWLIPIGIAAIDRLDATRYLRGADWRDRLLAILLFPAEVFSLVREAWTVKSLMITIRRRSIRW